MPFANLAIFLFFVALGVVFMIGAGLALALLLGRKPKSPLARFFLVYFPLSGAVVTAAAPIVFIVWLMASGPARDFETFFGEAPPAGVRILNSAGGFGGDFLEIDLLLSTPDETEWRRLATAAALDLSTEAPLGTLKCSGPVEVWELSGPDPMRWTEKWALYCPADSRARARAVMID